MRLPQFLLPTFDFRSLCYKTQRQTVLLMLTTFLFLSPTVAEYIIQGVKKGMTSRVQKRTDNSAKKVGIYKCSDDGKVLTSENLDGPSYCRICEAVTKTYSESFHHNTFLLCLSLTPPYTISCPFCSDVTFNQYEVYLQHINQHRDLLNIPFIQGKGWQTDMDNKTYTLIWMVELLKKIIQVDGENSKSFLPALTSKMIRSPNQTLNLTLCKWPICVIASKDPHMHGEETDGVTGKCRWCNNFHHAKLSTGDMKGCATAGFRGTLPM